jgi:DNA-binding transcriptional MerR regulator
MPSQPSQRPGSAKTEIPDKLYFRIGEVARLCALPAYVLRFWESEFPQLRPNKSGTGQRLYRKRDVEMALQIKRLLYDEGYTIAGARQVFQSETRKKTGQADLPLATASANAPEQKLNRVRSELRDLLGLLSRPAASGRRTSRSKREPQAGSTDSKLFDE